MPKTVDDTLLPRPPQLLDTPARADATRRAAERLVEQFNLTPEAAEALAAAAVDPAEIRKASENPEQLLVPGGTLLGLRTRLWARRVMPDPRNPRVSPARRHPIAVRPGTAEDSRFRPIPEPESERHGRPELRLNLESREHLSWASAIAQTFILKDNDWRASIRNQGVMTEVWVSAVTLVHKDGTAPATVAVTSEGSSRVTACHDILDIRSADVPYARDDRGLRSLVRRLNDAVATGATVEQAEVLRCETIPALLLVGFEPHPDTSASFATAVRSLVALRHVEPPKQWSEATKMGSIADAVIDALAERGQITEAEASWLSGSLTAEDAVAAGFSGDPAIRAARIVRLLTDTDPSIHQTIRTAITGQTTKKRITNDFKLEIAAALLLRSVTSANAQGKASDIYRGLQTGYSNTLATNSWAATFRPTGDLVEAALKEVQSGDEHGPSGLELAARATYPLIVNRQLFPDRHAVGNQPDRQTPGRVVERMRTSEWGVRQLGQALRDHDAGRPVRAIGADGATLETAGGVDEQLVSDDWLRMTFPPPGRPVAPLAPETAHEKFSQALAGLGEAMSGLEQAVRRLDTIEGVDGRPLIKTDGVDPAHADAWLASLMHLLQEIPVWKATYAARNGPGFESDGDGEYEDEDQDIDGNGEAWEENEI